MHNCGSRCHNQQHNNCSVCCLLVNNSNNMDVVEKRGNSSWHIIGPTYYANVGLPMLAQHYSNEQTYVGLTFEANSGPIVNFSLGQYKTNSSMFVGLPSVFDTVGWMSGRPSGLQKNEWYSAGMVICLEQDANDLMPLSLSLHHLLLHWNPDWFNLSSAGLPKFCWKRGH